MRIKDVIIVKIANLVRLLRGEMPTSFLIKRGLIVGERFSRQGGCRIDPSYVHLIEIGDDVELAPNVTILAHDNSLKKIVGLCKIGKVKIGNNVFVGAGSIILPNVVIGDNVVIGAGSIVSRSLEANAVYAGVPAKTICSIEDYKNKTISKIKMGGKIFERKYSTFNLSKEEKSYRKSVCDKGIGYLQSENYSQFTDSL